MEVVSSGIEGSGKSGADVACVGQESGDNGDVACDDNWDIDAER